MRIEQELQGLLPKFKPFAPSDVSKNDLILSALQRASGMLAPAWSAQQMIAVNPLHGFKDTPFLEAIKYMQAASGARLLPDTAFFREKFQSGEIQSADVTFAVQQLSLRAFSGANLSIRLEDAVKALHRGDTNPKLLIKCLSDCIDGEQNRGTTAWIAEECSKWLAAYFDQGQAFWPMPHKDERLFRAWKKLVDCENFSAQSNSLFRNDFKKLIDDLPESPLASILQIAKSIEPYKKLDFEQWVNYFFRLLCSVQGWAGYIQGRMFERERSGSSSATAEETSLEDLLAIRMIYDAGLANRLQSSANFRHALRTPRSYLQELDYNYLWLLAFERSYRKRLLEQLLPRTNSGVSTLPEAQLAFCIDVRSEALRRNLEKASSGIETIGFAGFFGLPISIRTEGHAAPEQRCPILIEPSHEVTLTNKDSARLKSCKERASHKCKFWQKIQKSAASCFSFVESLWLPSLYKMLSCSVAKDTPNVRLEELGLAASEKDTLRINAESLGTEVCVEFAAGALRGMGLTKDFAPLVAFIGHESESVNNPHASGLDCGACAGGSGLHNARALADILNTPQVREELANKHKIVIPPETLFCAGVHNTTRDTVCLDPLRKSARAEHIQQHRKLQSQLDNAGKAAFEERGKFFNAAEQVSNDIEAERHLRASDWSEVRPEWGLAGNASILFAPRARTRGTNLWGRSFLHNYDSKQDVDGQILEQLLSAPMVVANWINMQYYASTLDQERFGSGDKTTQNVVAGLGVIQGAAGDLRNGLSEQSVRQYGAPVHLPVRLQVIVEAAPKEIESVMSRQQIVSELIGNQWVNLICVDPNTGEQSLFESNGWLKL